MSDSTQTQESSLLTRRASPSVIVVILLLVVATVGGSFSFLYDSFLVRETVFSPAMIERFEQSGTPSVKLEMKGASIVEAGDFTEEVDGPNGKLFLSDEGLITNDAFKATGIREVDGNWVIGVEFTEEGAKNAENLTKGLVARNRDKPTRRLAILIDGELKAAPKVVEPIEGPAAEIHLATITKQQAEKLAKGIVGAD